LEALDDDLEAGRAERGTRLLHLGKHLGRRFRHRRRLLQAFEHAARVGTLLLGGNPGAYCEKENGEEDCHPAHSCACGPVTPFWGTANPFEIQELAAFFYRATCVVFILAREYREFLPVATNLLSFEEKHLGSLLQSRHRGFRGLKFRLEEGQFL